MNKVWTDAEKNVILTSANTVKDKDLVTKIQEVSGRAISVQAVRKQRQKMGLHKVAGRGKCELRPVAAEVVPAV